MVKVHGKSSKRISLRRRYNIQKKCRSAKKKTAKLARKMKKMGIVKKPQREPSIPNSYPFKHKLINEMEEKQRDEVQIQKEKKILRHKLKKQLAKEALQKKEDKEDEHDYVDQITGKIIKYQEKWESKEDEGDESDGKVQQPRKVYQRELKNIIEQSDVVLEILDARDPIGSRHFETEELIKSKNKMLVLVLNKTDLVPKENAKQWQKGLRSYYPTVMYKSTDQYLNSITASKKDSAEDQEESKIITKRQNNTEKLLIKIKKYCDKFRVENKKKGNVIVSVIGFPNAGKYTLISNLKKINTMKIVTMFTLNANFVVYIK